jgi:hypothetical protein
MRSRKIALMSLVIGAALTFGSRRANAQVAFQGTFAGPHGAVSVGVGQPYGYPASYGHPYPAYGRHYYGAYYRPGYYPRYRVSRIFVPFPFPHYVVRRVPVPIAAGPGWGY